MAYTADFRIINNSGIDGITLIEPMNPEAQNYLQDEWDHQIMAFGYATMNDDNVATFVDSAERAHLYAAAI